MQKYKFRTVTVQYAIYIVFGFIVVIGIASILVTNNSLGKLRAALQDITLQEQPSVFAAYEMEINAIGINRGVLAYLLMAVRPTGSRSKKTSKISINSKLTMQN